MNRNEDSSEDEEAVRGKKGRSFKGKEIMGAAQYLKLMTEAQKKIDAKRSAQQQPAYFYHPASLEKKGLPKQLSSSTGQKHISNLKTTKPPSRLRDLATSLEKKKITKLQAEVIMSGMKMAQERQMMAQERQMMAQERQLAREQLRVVQIQLMIQKEQRDKIIKIGRTILENQIQATMEEE